jgi:DNA-binding transcriptional MerR regulator
MKEEEGKQEKMYYRIGEVADMFGVNVSLIRYWEKEFPQIKPTKNKRGSRFYTKADIETIALIYHLVKERRMTLTGAKLKMQENKEDTIRQFQIVSKLKNIREELLQIKKEMEEGPE